MSCYAEHCNSPNAENQSSSDLASEAERIQECNVEGEDSEVFSNSTSSKESLSVVCSGLGLTDNKKSQRQLVANVSHTSDTTVRNSDCWRVSIDDLPDEILVKVFSHMSFSELVDVVQKVCTRWKRLSQDAELWSDKEYLVTSREFNNFHYFKAGKTDQEAIQMFCDCPNLRRVSMWRGAKARVIRALSNRCHRLSMLYLGPTQKLSYEVLKNLVEKCSRIHTLRISNELLKSEKFAKAVSQLQHLCVLDLQEHFVKNKPQLWPLGDGCPQLTAVNFGFMSVDMDDLRYFLNAKRNTIKSIGIKWTMEEGRCVLPLLSVCADSLEYLELYEYDVVDEDASEAFIALRSLRNLRTLKMSIINPALPGTAALAFETGGLANLRALHLENGFSLDDQTVIAICRGCPVLQELNVRNAELLSDTAFSQIYRLKHLEILDLSGCVSLGGALFPYLTRLPRLHTLWMEELDFTVLQPGLSSILQLSSIQCLKFNYSTLTGVPFDKFPGKLVNLRELYMCLCQGDSEDIDMLTEQMPGLRIYFSIHEQEVPEDPEGLELDIDYAESEYEDSDGELHHISETEEDSVG